MGGFLVVISMVTGTASFIALFRPLPRIGLPTRNVAFELDLEDSSDRIGESCE